MELPRTVVTGIIWFLLRLMEGLLLLAVIAQVIPVVWALFHIFYGLGAGKSQSVVIGLWYLLPSTALAIFCLLMLPVIRRAEVLTLQYIRK
jgi:hypothetical protein